MGHVQYMDRIREYYIAQGYEKPYVWAHHDDVPFTPLPKPLAECRVTLLSTSDVALKDEQGNKLPQPTTTVGDVYSLPFGTPPDRIYSNQDSYDAYATTLEDPDAYLPLSRLREFVAAGRIGAVTENFHNLNRGYSQRAMLEKVAPNALAKVREEGADVAVLTPV